MKRIIFRTLLLCLICISIPLPTKAYDFYVDGLYYNVIGAVSDNTVEVTYYRLATSDNKNYVSGSISIPAKVTYHGTVYSVTSIGSCAFRGCTGLTSVTIPNSVTSIDEGSFYGCTGLTSVTIPNSVTDIGRYAFKGCTGLTSVTIPNSVTSIDSYAFLGCTGLTSVTIPNSVTSIGFSAFEGCTGLTSVTIPNSVTSIDSYAFLGCTGLTSVTIPNSVTCIGSNPFSGCQNLETIKVESGNTHYDSRGDCNAIINTRENVLISGCNYTEIPNSVTSIGFFAFEGCTGLTSVTIPNSVTSIGSSAFSRCTGLTSVTIPNSVTSIGSSAFYRCTGLTSVAIPNSVTSIGMYAFAGCTGLTSVTIPNSVTSIGESAFERCTGLTSVTIPNSVTSIGESAFYRCTGLTSVAIPNSVTSIGMYAFKGCTGLTTVNYDIINLPSPSSIDDAIFKDCSNITTFAIGNSVKSIPNYLCYGQKKIQSIMVPNSVTSIGSSAFSGCIGLSSITIPNSVTSIGSSAFQGCENAIINAFPTPYFILLGDSKSHNWSSICLVGASCFIFKDYNVHQESIKFVAEYNSSEPAPEGYENLEPNSIESGILFNKVYYPFDSEGIVIIKNLYTKHEYYFCNYIKYSDGKAFVGDKIYITTDNLHLTRTLTEESSTSVLAQFDFKKDDVLLQSENITFNGQTIPGKQLKVTGLKPNTTYNAVYMVTTKGGSTETLNYTFTTPKLKLEMLNPKSVTNSIAIVSAETNMSEIETSAGFQWKKYDAPDALAPREAFSAIYNGRLEGSIKNLQSTTYYNVRAFYKDAEGTYYYTDWVMFDPSDFSYFDPTVHTYPTNEMTATSATVKGYVLQGSDEILSQGIEYWRAGSSKAPMKMFSPMVTNDKDTVFSTGQVMIVTLNDLKPNTAYCYRAFVTTQSGTTYGEEQTFTTDFGVGDVNLDGFINVSDVTTLVGKIVESDDYVEDVFDVNGDEVINVSDVTTLVNTILTIQAAKKRALEEGVKSELGTIYDTRNEPQSRDIEGKTTHTKSNM